MFKMKLSNHHSFVLFMAGCVAIGKMLEEVKIRNTKRFSDATKRDCTAAV